MCPCVVDRMPKQNNFLQLFKLKAFKRLEYSDAHCLPSHLIHCQFLAGQNIAMHASSDQNSATYIAMHASSDQDSTLMYIAIHASSADQNSAWIILTFLHLTVPWDNHDGWLSIKRQITYFI